MPSFMMNQEIVWDTLITYVHACIHTSSFLKEGFSKIITKSIITNKWSTINIKGGLVNLSKAKN